ncbi:MAG: primosomal protein N' [Saprospiraceae bacterium]|nr:primosomal protein N' [Saprospiraceae bacterium]
MGQQTFLPTEATSTFVDVLLPVAIPRPYTYAVPEELLPQTAFGVQVEVQFGKNKLYAGLVVRVHQEAPTEYRPKPILSIIRPEAIIQPPQWEFWQWMANYYACMPGEVMHAALPANLKLASETKVFLSPLYDHSFEGLSDKEFLVAEALSIQKELSIGEIQGILQQKTVHPIINQLLEKRVVYLQEELSEKYKPRTVACVGLQEPYDSQPELLEEAFELLSRSNRQMEALMAFIQLSRKGEPVLRQMIYDKAQVDSSVLKAIEKKGIFRFYDREVSRLPAGEEPVDALSPLSEQQLTALEQIRRHWESTRVVLLHGVTGSGKTRVYMELIQETIDRGGQVLYLLPEIALTTQIIARLQKTFGDQVAVYHSRLNNNERVELWRNVAQGAPVVLGARSALFLPFSKLELVVVDEEHDPSFKQQDPAPRYNGRDAGIYLATLFDARVILGTATPAIETFYNTKKGKYGLVTMPDRFGGIQLPEIAISDLRKAQLRGSLHSHFTADLLEALEKALANGEQAILFQNRRGYAPTLRCTACGWNQQCQHCDVSLTYHKYQHNLQCHYCGYRMNLPKNCPACGHDDLRLQGFGTEKIEDELQLYLPDARIARMDLDTVRSKNAHAKIINDFEERRLDILVGTQMVTKGLDFDNVAVVGVVSADQLLQFPDFRAGERSFQLLTQVAGRSGRQNKRGNVIIQAANIQHPVLGETIANDYKAFYAREIMERQAFKYPPFVRLIKITLKHKKLDTLHKGGAVFAKHLKHKLGTRVIGPAVPYVSRVRGYYLLDLLLKLERQPALMQASKDLIAEATYVLHRTEGCSTVRVNVDVDPN